MKTIDVTGLIIGELEVHYNYAFKIDFELLNYISIYYKTRDRKLFMGEIYFSLEVNSSDLVEGIEIGGPGFTCFDEFDNETECIYSKKQIRSYIEEVLYGYISRDYQANYYHEDY